MPETWLEEGRWRARERSGCRLLSRALKAFFVGLASVRMPNFHLEDAEALNYPLCDGDYLAWSAADGQGGASVVIVRDDGARFNLNLEVTVTKLPPTITPSPP